MFHIQALERLRSLQELVIYHCHAVQERTLKTISRSCINLKKLHLFLFDGYTVKNSLNFNNLVKLENISIIYDLGISGDYITCMALNCRELINIDIRGKLKYYISIFQVFSLDVNYLITPQVAIV